ncbi:hypothetical protein L873DRAFT_1742456 [Choiromyces venosus 120613-1]|uniref:CENP-V/GFA domain-containing protein n=1 Tax=Choiromyces venosus 120613-1 TaxID=1336337 RepID=A0A3N4JG45_9PEZI|nr:hypothetical protein L873DRAFT_1742456 [Choiromyces venosus 120613-1]
MNIPGHCHCGQLQWTTHLPTGSLPDKIICHCKNCKAFGGAYSVNMTVPKEQVEMTKGTPKIYTYTGHSGNPVDCYYCGNCTTHAYHHQRALGDRLTMRPLLWEHEMAQEGPVEMEVFAKDRCAFQPIIARSFDVMDS